MSREAGGVDLVAWALAVPISATSQAIGRHGVRLVLAALAGYADDGGHAWPGSQTIADGVDGMTRRDVRNALDLLERSEVISRAGTVGRSVRYRLAGYPAVASYPQAAGNPATEVAGPLAGRSAGRSAGYPAPKGREGTSTRAREKPRTRLPWCGNCNPDTRMDETDPDLPHRCAACHEDPKRLTAVAS